MVEVKIGVFFRRGKVAVVNKGGLKTDEKDSLYILTPREITISIKSFVMHLEKNR